MARTWTRAVRYDGSKTLVVARKGTVVTASGEWNRTYTVIHGACQKCYHPAAVGASCSTCVSWRHLERIVAMGAYIPPKKQIGSLGADLSKDLLSAKNSRYTAKMLGLVLGAFAVEEHEDILAADIVHAVPSQAPPGQADLITDAFCQVVGGNQRSDLIVRTNYSKLTYLGREQRREKAAEQYQKGTGALEKGSAVLLVDDILTDGATMDVCAGVLKSLGASKVAGIVVGRTV